MGTARTAGSAPRIYGDLVHAAEDLIGVDQGVEVLLPDPGQCAVFMRSRVVPEARRPGAVTALEGTVR
jgi:hypothetical protein